MARFGGKNQQNWSSRRTYLILLACVLLVGIFFMTDLFFASSTSTATYSSTPASLGGISQFPSIDIVPYTDGLDGGSVEAKREDLSVVRKDLNATFADLPAPMLEWEEMPKAPVVRLDGAAIQIGELLYVFAGYGSIDLVYSHVDVYNFTSNTWGGRFDMPKEMAHSHLGMVTDGRYIYVVSGQYGPQCRGPISRCFVLDTKTKEWHDLLSLPAPRYAPATQLWRGRLHVMGGSKEDRHEIGSEHWSLAVKDGKALETEWRPEIPIPRGGPHRACVVANDKLFVIGGQEGDFIAKPGSPIFRCTRKEEVVYGDVYMLDGDGKKWKELAPMPKPDSHIEFAWQIVNNSKYSLTRSLAALLPPPSTSISPFPRQTHPNRMLSAAKSRLCAAFSCRDVRFQSNPWRNLGIQRALSTWTDPWRLELGEVEEILNDVKAGDVKVIPVQGLCQWTDFMVIATGRSTWHVRNIAQALIHKVKEKQKGNDHISIPRVEGYEGGKWVVINSGNVTIHALDEKARLYYNLESIWTGKKVPKEPDLEIA